MKTMKKIQILMLSFMLLFVFASPGLSALSTQTTTEDEIEITVYKNAPGTKLSGPMTIYYVPTGVTGVVDMYVFLRLRKGYELYAASTMFEDVEYNADDLTDQENKINNWIKDEVIPDLYCPPYDPLDLANEKNYRDPYDANKECCKPEDRNWTTHMCEPDTQLEFPPFLLKSVDQVKEDDPVCYFCTDHMYFTIMDVVIAVQD